MLFYLQYLINIIISDICFRCVRPAKKCHRHCWSNRIRCQHSLWILCRSRYFVTVQCHLQDLLNIASNALRYLKELEEPFPQSEPASVLPECTHCYDVLISHTKTVHASGQSTSSSYLIWGQTRV